MQLFVTGMFRSGTTLIARMLNVHSQIASASDPMRPVFNSFRYDVSDLEYQKENYRFDPLEDYFMSGSGMLRDILEADFNRSIDGDCSEIFKAVKERAAKFSKLWSDSLDQDIEFKSYKDFLVYGLDHIRETYGVGKKVLVTAFKEVWCNEFIPAFLKTFPGSKSVILIRDPRAITASNIASGAKYPLFFITRQWRKLAFLSHLIKARFPDRVRIIKYEILVKEPEREVGGLCDFIGIPFEEELLDLSNYLDGENKPWKQNTNFSYKTKQTINLDSINKWREKLKDPELMHVELVSRDWLEVFGYECLFPLESLLNLDVRNLRRWNENELSDWIKPYSFDHIDEVFWAEVSKEKERLQSAYSKSPLIEDDAFRLQIKNRND